MRYYRVALALARRFCPNGKSVLDVGGADCEYIHWFEWFPLKKRVDIRPIPSLFGAEAIQMDFLDYKPAERFDLVLCLQVLEHVSNPVSFSEKLINTGRVVIISVPYKWPKGTCKSHVNDPIDEEKLKRWLGVNWRAARIVRDHKLNRLVVVV